MNLRGNGPSRLIDDLPYPGERDVLALGDEEDLMLRLSAQVAHEMQVLSGEVLVNAKHFHL
jgi:hypothetical protein